MNEPPQADVTSGEDSLRARLGAAFNRLNVAYSAAVMIAGIGGFAIYYSFSGDDNIKFINPNECSDNLVRDFSSYPLDGKTLLVYTQTKFYPSEYILQWHDNLRRVMRELDDSDLAVVYLSATPCLNFPGQTRIGRSYRHRRFIKSHNLHGYHLSIELDAKYDFARDNDVDHSRSFPLFWIIPADRSKVIADKLFISEPDYDAFVATLRSVMDS